MGQHDGLGLWADGGLDLAGIYVVGQAVHIHEDRHGAELDDGVDRGGEAGSDADDLVALLDGALAQFGRGERAEGDQVGRRARVNGDEVLNADEGSQLLLELGVETARGQPAVQRGIDHQLQLFRADDLA